MEILLGLIDDCVFAFPFVVCECMCVYVLASVFLYFFLTS